LKKIKKIKERKRNKKGAKRKNLSYNNINRYASVCDLHVCMCFCGHFDEEKNIHLTNFFFSNKFLKPPIIKK